ncbi:MAG: cobalt-precorrin 5A hydrolase [Bacillota bacterium]
MEKDYIVIALTKKGTELAKKLASHLKADIKVPRRFLTGDDQVPGYLGPVAEEIQAAFPKYSALILIMAAGIAVRSIAPVLKNKQTDPAVLVIDEEGRFVISLLSGHWGGANQLAAALAKFLKGTAVITTASDINELPSLDLLAKEQKMEIDRPDLLPKFSGAIVNGEPLVVWDHWGLELNWPENVRVVKEKPPQFTAEEKLLVIIGFKEAPVLPPGLNVLALRPRCLTVGIGCCKGVPGVRIGGAIRRYFREHYWSIRSLKAIATIDLKEEEPGLTEACKELEVPLVVFTREQLAKAMPGLKNSQFVLDTIGVGGVCEPAAILGAKNGKLIGAKQNLGQITVAVALDSSR